LTDRRFRFPDGSSTYAFLVDVLHHTQIRASASMRQSGQPFVRAAEGSVATKKPSTHIILRFMDWVGANLPHGVVRRTTTKPPPNGRSIFQGAG